MTTHLDERHDRRPQAPPRADAGPAVDPDSPFREERARQSRERARAIATEGRSHTLLAWLVVVVILAAAAYAGVRLTGYRLAGEAKLDVGPAVLAASPVDVPAPADGQVVRLFVHPSQRVHRGATLARVRLFGTGPGGRPTSSPATLTAPIDGVVGSVAAPRGDAVRRGDTVVQLYEPRADTFQATVSTATLGRLRRGMHATLASPALAHPLAAVVDHVIDPTTASDAQPPQPGRATTAGTMTLVLRPVHPAALGQLVPGLTVDAVVDTSTAPEHAPSLVRVAA